MNFTREHKEALTTYLANHSLPAGIGTEESACSIAAINLAISGELTDSIPDCMSLVLGRATIRLQDAMPDEMRNSARYKTLLPEMAGTGRDREKERAGILVDWMWRMVLPSIQNVADAGGFGREWKRMCEEKTHSAAYAAADAAAAAADAARAAARAAAWAARAAADAAAYAARAAACAAWAAWAAWAAQKKKFWAEVDPIGALERATFLTAP